MLVIGFPTNSLIGTLKQYILRQTPNKFTAAKPISWPDADTFYLANLRPLSLWQLTLPLHFFTSNSNYKILPLLHYTLSSFSFSFQIIYYQISSHIPGS
ncbi:hypothetical protein VNO77_00915 [Canavalia gladiata]|uniref:Uncharacterized protein n=1 Tax=Canavalia gladiata TaxID=3824 RepID=A0AAN9MVL7_CANGL